LIRFVADLPVRSMVSINLVPDPDHPEGGHAILEVTLSGPAHAGDCEIRIKQKADELWLHPHGWGEGRGESLRINATKVQAAGNELRLKLGPDIVRHLTIGIAYLVESPSHEFSGPFRVRENIKIAPQDEGHGHEVGDQIEPLTTERRPIVGAGSVRGRESRSSNRSRTQQHTSQIRPRWRTHSSHSPRTNIIIAFQAPVALKQMLLHSVRSGLLQVKVNWSRS
jgi:hypothetical protein